VEQETRVTKIRGGKREKCNREECGKENKCNTEEARTGDKSSRGEEWDRKEARLTKRTAGHRK
jgi:hypothetical protein